MGVRKCFLGDSAQGVYFHLPVLLLMLINGVFFVITITTLYRWDNLVPYYNLPSLWSMPESCQFAFTTAFFRPAKIYRLDKSTYLVYVLDTCSNACVTYNPNKEAVFSRIVESEPSEIWGKKQIILNTSKEKVSFIAVVVCLYMKENYQEGLNSQLSQQTLTMKPLFIPTWSLRRVS